jgi:transcriptional regulator with XRE-family HTH domain
VARARQRITQDQLAQKAQPPIERAHVGAIERGEREPGLVLIVRLAQALGMSPARLMEAMEEEREG